MWNSLGIWDNSFPTVHVCFPKLLDGLYYLGFDIFKNPNITCSVLMPVL